MRTGKPFAPGVQRVLDTVVFHGGVLRHCEAQLQAVCSYATRLERLVDAAEVMCAAMDTTDDAEAIAGYVEAFRKLRLLKDAQ